MTIQEDTYIYKKEVDWSLLHEGLTIPISIQVVFHKMLQDKFPRGSTKNINLIFNGVEYPVKLINQKFNAKKYPKHKDLIQIRYLPTSKLAVKLRSIFINSYNFIKKIKEERILQGIKKRKIFVSDEFKEYFVLYTTQFENSFLLDCITNEDIKVENSYISKFSEEEFEMDINYNRKDLTAKIEEKTKIVKIRKLDKSISDNLKLLYQHKCQICGLNFGDNYNGKIVEAHHIEYFTKSLNNNSDNIMIICPNHHRLIHKVKPTFDKSNLLFLYQNGYQEKLAINYHL